MDKYIISQLYPRAIVIYCESKMEKKIYRLTRVEHRILSQSISQSVSQSVGRSVSQSMFHQVSNAYSQ